MNWLENFITNKSFGINMTPKSKQICAAYFSHGASEVCKQIMNKVCEDITENKTDAITSDRLIEIITELGVLL